MSAPVSIIVKTKEFSDMVTPVLRIFISGGSCHKNVHIYSLTQALCVALYLYYESLGAVINANVFFSQFKGIPYRRTFGRSATGREKI